MIGEKVCQECNKKYEVAKSKYSRIFIFHIVMLILGCLMLIPFFFIGFIGGIIVGQKIPNDQMHKQFKNFNTLYTWMDLVMLIVMIAIFGFTAVCIIIPMVVL